MRFVVLDMVSYPKLWERVGRLSEGKDREKTLL